MANEQLELEETVDQYELVDNVKEDLNFIDYDEELDFEWDVIDIKNMKDQAVDSEEKSGFSLQSISGQWIQSGSRWWYRHSDGSYTTSDWEYINVKWYYFDSEGWMVTGWVNDGGYYYYCNSSGEMVTGWNTVSGNQYYFSSSGAMQTHWILISGKYYYFDADGKYVDNTGTKMISEALKYEGNPYISGGNSLTNGTDCSGYVYLIHQLYGIATPRIASLQYSAANSISSSNLKPGDLVFYCEDDGVKIKHVAFYVGTIDGKSDRIIHAANPSQGIIISTRTYWSAPKKHATFWR